MKENNTYHEEWDDLNLPESFRVNPFLVPNQYFEVLENEILAQIRLENSVVPTTSSFSVPDNYFESLDQNIIAQIHLENLSSAAELPFTVPDQYFSNLTTQLKSHMQLDKQMGDQKFGSIPLGYFEDMTEKIQSAVKIETYASREEGLVVPSDYFEDMSSRINAKIFEDNLKETLSTDGFTAPAHYFENLSDQIKGRILASDATIQQPKTEPATIRRLNLRTWVRYVAAACVATVLGTVSYNVVTEQKDTNTTASHLQEIPEQEIINYLASSHNSDDMLYIMEYIYEPEESEGVGSQVKKDDIEDYLNYML
ncbi:hypothetical protein [Sphingobacterium sp. LRF_L2]|uniref:hypothetical protein n=1 Tax=Sphingobacterium sp. LRF_L2 TaxID=3369421 RepID=UPI003F60FD47